MPLLRHHIIFSGELTLTTEELVLWSEELVGNGEMNQFLFHASLNFEFAFVCTTYLPYFTLQVENLSTTDDDPGGVGRWLLSSHPATCNS